MTIFVADSHATGAAVSLIVGVERAGETRGGSAGVRVGELESLHWERGVKRVKESFYDTKGENSFMLFSGSAAVGGSY